MAAGQIPTTDLRAPGARDLTEEEQEARAQLCFELEDKIKANLHSGREAFWELARNLYEFDQEEGWSALGYETQTEWLAQPDISMTRSAYFALVRRHRELVIVRQLPSDALVELDPSKVDIVMPSIEHNRGKLEDILEDIRELGARDLRDKYVKSRKSRAQTGIGDNGAGEDDDGVIETVARTVTGDGKLSDLDYAVAAVDSWLSMGGDKRKVRRNWGRFKDNLPLFSLLAIIEATIEGSRGPDVPSREAAHDAWREVCEILDLRPEEIG